MGERPVQKCACEADCAWCVGANDPMTPHELADALDAHAARNVPGENTAFVRVNVTLLSDAAQRLRELEAVRHAALMLVQANNNDASMPLLMALHDALDAALARVGGGT